MKTYFPKEKDAKETWYLVDADGQTLGRLASQVAYILRGKHLALFTPHFNPRVFIVIVNADKVNLTGNKRSDKVYYWNTGYPGGLRSRTAEQLLDQKPREVLRHAVWGMLPKSALGYHLIKNLKIYAGPNHRHKAQCPEVINIDKFTGKGKKKSLK